MNTSALARHNFLFMLLEGAMFHIGYSLMQTDTVIAKFIDISAHSTVLAGFAASIGSFAFLLGQVVGGAYLHRVRVQSRHMALVGLFSRGLMLIVAAALALGLRGLLSAWLFLVLYAAFLLTDGAPGGGTRTYIHYFYDVGFRTSKFGRGSACAVMLFLVVMLVSIVQTHFSNKMIKN